MKTLGLIVINVATVGILSMAQGQPVAGHEKKGVIPHEPLLKTAVPDTKNQEVAVYHVDG